MSEPIPSRRCTKCGLDKPLTEFSPSRNSPDGRKARCKSCRRQDYAEADHEQTRIQSRRSYETNREQRLEQMPQYREANREQIREQQRQYYADNREQRLEYNRQYRQDNLEQLREYDRERNTQRWQDPEYRVLAIEQQRARDDALRARIFAHYGTSCACCGATEDLCIDHVNGGGKDHRIELFGRNNVSLQLYRWLIEQGFPEGYQTLCRPCNTSKRDGERCRLEHVRT